MNELQHVLDRIPKRWGRYLSVYSGWHELIKELDKSPCRN